MGGEFERGRCQGLNSADDQASHEVLAEKMLVSDDTFFESAAAEDVFQCQFNEIIQVMMSLPPSGHVMLMGGQMKGLLVDGTMEAFFIPHVHGGHIMALKFDAKDTIANASDEEQTIFILDSWADIAADELTKKAKMQLPCHIKAEDFWINPSDKILFFKYERINGRMRGEINIHCWLSPSYLNR